MRVLKYHDLLSYLPFLSKLFYINFWNALKLLSHKHVQILALSMYETEILHEGLTCNKGMSCFFICFICY